MRFNVPFVLASQSPRRRRLLERLGVDFDVVVSGVDEKISDDLPADRIVEELALRKARDVARLLDGSLVLGADTIVVLDGDILEKPTDENDAVGMLHRLSNRTHTVFTGIALVHLPSHRIVCTHEATQVSFDSMDTDEIEAYVSSGSPLDKAGAYGIQDDRGALFVRGIEGDYYNVVGLPLHRLYTTIKDHFSDLMDSDETRYE